MLHTVKKLVALLLAVLLTLSFAACGEQELPAEIDDQQFQASQDTTRTTEDNQIQPSTGGTAPAQTEPDTTQPTETEPTVTEPIVTAPIVTEPVVTESPATKPAVTEPVVTEPMVTEPPVTEPVVTEPPVTEPVVTEPPVTEPVVTEPPVTEPVVTEPPATEPPATQAPTDDSDNYFFNENNNGIDTNAISIKPRYVYWENGQLVAECFVINGFPHTVGNINVKALEIYNESGLIASGGFGELQGLVLSSGYHGVWKFVFSADCVATPNAALQILTLQYNVSNRY